MRTDQVEIGVKVKILERDSNLGVVGMICSGKLYDSGADVCVLLPDNASISCTISTGYLEMFGIPEKFLNKNFLRYSHDDLLVVACLDSQARAGQDLNEEH